jgi:hypothetical protein
MKTAFVLVSSGLLFSLCACGTVNTLQADGGRDRLSCAKDFTAMAVKVQDAKGLPVADVTVTATNSGTQVTQTGQTDLNGNTTSVNQDIGQGTISVTAALGARSTETKNATWTCSDQCLCVVQPKTLTLTLSP